MTQELLHAMGVAGKKETDRKRQRERKKKRERSSRRGAVVNESDYEP